MPAPLVESTESRNGQRTLDRGRRPYPNRKCQKVRGSKLESDRSKPRWPHWKAMPWEVSWCSLSDEAPFRLTLLFSVCFHTDGTIIWILTSTRLPSTRLKRKRFLTYIKSLETNGLISPKIYQEDQTTVSRTTSIQRIESTSDASISVSAMRKSVSDIYTHF